MDGVAVEVMEATPVESLPTDLVEALAASDILVTKRLGLDTPLARYLAAGDRPMAMGVALPGADGARSLGYLVVGSATSSSATFSGRICSSSARSPNSSPLRYITGGCTRTWHTGRCSRRTGAQGTPRPSHGPANRGLISSTRRPRSIAPSARET